MAGIGEASAIIGVVQVGFSLARTLNTYIGDFKDSRESIISLAAELDATIIQVQELNSLVASNKAANSLGEGSRKLAEKCVQDSDRLIKKLVELLTKARLPDDPKEIVNIRPEDIVIDKLTRAYWPFIKPQVDVVKSELHLMKTDILVARSCIQSQSASTPGDRDANGASIAALARSRKLARKILRKAKAKERRSTRYPTRRPRHRNQYNHRTGSDASKESALTRSTDSHAGSADSSTADIDNQMELVAEEYRKSVLEEIQREDAERKAQATADEEVRNRAVEAYQESVKQKLTRLRENAESTEQQIKETFGNAVNEDQVKEFLDKQRSQQMQDEFGETLLKLGVASPLVPKAPVQDVRAERMGMLVPKRRRFFHRNVVHPSQYSGASIDHVPLVGFSSSARTRTQFLHLALSYDSVEGRYNHQVLDNSALPHLPCGPSCDLKTTISTWQAVPQSVRQSAAAWVKNNFKDRVWQLHSAFSIVKGIRKLRKLLQRVILGTVVHRDMSGTLLVFSSVEDIKGLELKPDQPSPATPSKDAEAHVEVVPIIDEPSVVPMDPVEDAQQRKLPIDVDVRKAPIAFKDAVGRNFSFPYHKCKDWKDMERLIKQAFLHVDVIGQHVQEGHYDLMVDGEIILPQLWEAMVQPGWEVSMHMWPLPDVRKEGVPPPPEAIPGFDDIFGGMGLDDLRFAPPGSAKAKKADKKKQTSKSAPVVLVPAAPPPVPSSFRPAELPEGLMERSIHVPPKAKKKPKPQLSGFAAWMAGQRPKPSKWRDIPVRARSQSSSESDASFTSCDPGADEILEAESDAEDALLDDEQLKNKMMIKYTGSAVASSAPNDEIHVPAPDGQQNASEAEPPSPLDSVPMVSRQDTVISEDDHAGSDHSQLD